jgi:hypothetical protein
MTNLLNVLKDMSGNGISDGIATVTGRPETMTRKHINTGIFNKNKNIQDMQK